MSRWRAENCFLGSSVYPELWGILLFIDCWFLHLFFFMKLKLCLKNVFHKIPESLLFRMDEKTELQSFLVLKHEVAAESKPGFLTNLVCCTTDISASVIYYAIKELCVRFSVLAFSNYRGAWHGYFLLESS